MKKEYGWIILLILAISLTACELPASTPPAGSGQSGATNTPGGPPAETPDALKTLIAVELATQTAMATTPQPGGEQLPTAVPPVEETAPAELPTATPVVPTPVPPTATPVPTAIPQANCQSPYTVKKGDWVWDIGRRCNIHPNSIIAANGLYWPYTIYPGDILILPANAPPFPGP